MNLRIVFATSEAVPFAKTGGLGDVCGTLSPVLAKMGHEVTVIMPLYRCVRYGGFPLEPLGITYVVPIGTKTVTGRLAASHIPNSPVRVIFVEQDQYYDRDDLYHEGGNDYLDNCERFVFFCRSVLEVIRLLDLRPDVLHCHDWQSGLVPAYLRLEYQTLPRYRQIGTLFTIHNMAYQGVFWHWDMILTGLDWKHFNWRELEFFGHLSFLKAGIVYSTAISTVSPQYAQDIQTPEFGCRMEGLLQHRSDSLFGILNGVDTTQWNPATDRFLPRQYDVTTVAEGKAVCKAELQKELGLPVDPGAIVMASVGRLVDQKGSDILAKLIRQWAPWRPIQWVILGEGDSEIEESCRSLARDFPDKVVVRIEFSEPLAHRIIAGADIFPMPSRFEPCGLNQMYAQLYGTIPVVRGTGGLKDTVVDATPENVAAGRATGFVFEEASVDGLAGGLERAIAAFGNKDLWWQLARTGMQQDFSWKRSAQKYVEVYQWVIDRHRSMLRELARAG
ncbi:MAG: glycogen synthase GlgA [Thermoguttaceae bacterium]|nr:glycogen synthase GlgA [Thermoguttaceae bacterium]MDW8077994.1 glycogen synthase GlgA [Thermoguttaceae bacterium]